MRRNLKGKAAASKKQPGNSSATPTPTEDEQERSIWKLPWANALNFFGPAPGRSTPSPNPSRGPLKSGELLQQEASDLWDKAYNELPSKYKQSLEHDTDSDKSEMLEDLLGLAMEAKRKNIANQWIFKLGGKEVNMREKAEKLVGWIEKFKEVVTIAVQCDPVHAGLPWAGVRFILTACLSLFIPNASASLVVNY